MFLPEHRLNMPIEIDENLCRAERTPAQRAAAIARRKQIWEALHPEGVSGQFVPKPKGGRPNEFASETAAVSGETKRDINRHLSRAATLGCSLLKGRKKPALSMLDKSL